MALPGVTQRQDWDLSLHAARARRVEGYLVLPLAVALEKACLYPLAHFLLLKKNSKQLTRETRQRFKAQG